MSKMGNYYHELEELNNWKEGDNPSPVPCKKCKGKGLRWKRQRSMGRSGSSRAIATIRKQVNCNKCKGTGYGE